MEGTHLALKALLDYIKAHGQGLHSGQQAGGALHTMLVLQAYQAQLLKDLAFCANR